MLWKISFSANVACLHCSYSAVCRETNLKFRQALSVTHTELNGDSVKQNLAAFDGLYRLANIGVIHL